MKFRCFDFAHFFLELPLKIFQTLSKPTQTLPLPPADIAIGAPYENDGEGAVYIYLGGPDGVVQPESQKITPSDLPSNLPVTREIGNSFGYSVSGGIDLDGNQYPDLSVGAFEADTVVTFR